MVVDREVEILIRGTLRNIIEQATPENIARQLHDAGWSELATAYSSVSTRILFEEQGAAAARHPFPDLLICSHLGEDWSSFGVLYPLGEGDTPIPIEVTEQGGSQVQGLSLRPPQLFAQWLVPISDRSGPRIALINGRLEACETIDAIDGQPRARVSFEFDTDSATLSSATWEPLLARLRVAVAFELIALTRRMLALACSYVQDRAQFGRAIGTFQAVKHRLADVHVAITLAAACADEALEAGDPTTARLAKILAGRAGEVAASNCLQVMGAIGFTWEHEITHLIRRTMALDSLFGSTAALTRTVGDGIALTGIVPRLGTA